MHLCICGTKRSGVRDFCRRDAQQCPNVGVDMLLDVSVTRLATFTRMYDAVPVNFPLLLFAIPRTPCRDVCIRFPPYRAPLPWCRLQLFLCKDMWHVFEMTFPSVDLRRTVHLCRGVIRSYATTCGLFSSDAHPWPA